MIGIYKITNPKGKVYIGQSVDIERRKKEYSKKRIKGQTILHRSILKYGFENHIFEVIEECGIFDLNNKERYYQDLYSAVGVNGLNCKLTTSDCRSGSLSEDLKLKISLGNKGRILSEETKLKMSKAKKGIKTYKSMPISEITKKRISESKKGTIPWNKGLKRNDKELMKMSLNRKGKYIAEQNHNSVLILNTQTGMFYFGIKEAANSYDGNYHSMRDRLSGKTKNKTYYIKI